MILLVVLQCGACYSWVKIGLCPGHTADDEHVRLWYASHHAPWMDMIARL